MLGSDIPPPTKASSWLRTSMAPSESSPASISGASASTGVPAVRRTMLSTSSSGEARLGCDDSARLVVTVACSGVQNVDRKRGDPTAIARIRLHVTCMTPRMGSPADRTITSSAARPSEIPMGPRPLASNAAARRVAAALRVTMPISAHGPHWMLTDARPRECWQIASTSRQAFAAL